MGSDNAALVRQAFDAVWRDADFGLMSEDYLDHNPAPGRPGTLEGLQQLRELTLAGFPDFEVRVEETIAEGDLVAVRLTQTGTHEGTFMGIPPTGRRATWTTMAHLRVADGRVVERWGVVDGLALMRQLGAFG